MPGRCGGRIGHRARSIDNPMREADVTRGRHSPGTGGIRWRFPVKPLETLLFETTSVSYDMFHHLGVF